MIEAHQLTKRSAVEDLSFDLPLMRFAMPR
jgi:hypothetical protein